MEKLDSILNTKRQEILAARSHLRIVKDEQALALPVEQPCQKCKGVGFLRANVPFGHPDFGKALLCACKIAVRKEQRQQELLEVSGIDALSRFQNATFDSFISSVPNVRFAFRLSRQFAACPDGWLVLLGPYGCGKTHLAVAIAKERVAAGDLVLFQTVPDLLDYLRSAFSPTVPQTYDERLQEMKDVDVLVLDDYGTQQTTPWANEKMFQLLNYRYNKCLPTILTSNNSDLQGIDPRIASRLSDQGLVTMVKMQGARDYRVYRDKEEE